jgi:transcriptional regulator with XRE-family HTH domain
VSTIKITDAEIFSNRLKTLRNGRRKAAFAEYLNTSPQNYGRYEDGRIPSTVILSQIANRCGVTVDWLLGRDDTPLSKNTADDFVKGVNEVAKGSRMLKTLENSTSLRGLTKLEKGQGGCRYPESCDLEGELAHVRERLTGMEDELGYMRSQLDTVVGLLGAALRDPLGKGKQERKAG